MSNVEFVVCKDVRLSSSASKGEIIDDGSSYRDHEGVSSERLNMPILNFNLVDYLIEHGTDTEPVSIDELFPNSNFELTQDSFVSSTTSSMENPISFVAGDPIPPAADFNHHSCLSLTFSNPPEPTYHVRYLSEITNSPVDGNIVNTKKKTKKNISGRYLKGTHGRHVTVSLPSLLPEHPNLYIRVTRLTVPYKGITFVHPYPLLYSPPKKKMNTDVLIHGSSIYYKLTKEEILTHSKQFPNIILTRLKQCQLKHLTNLQAFENTGVSHPFAEENAKNKIATYQLKKSQLDFRVVVRCSQTGEFFDLNISCRSNPLLEEEGTECKKLSKSLPGSLKFLLGTKTQTIFF